MYERNYRSTCDEFTLYLNLSAVYVQLHVNTCAENTGFKLYFT